LRQRQVSTLLLFLAIFLLQVFSVQAPISSITNARTYLPGDIVHVIVDAPVDTVQITSTMPDGTIISLIQGRSTNIWRGIWQVPVDFKAGTYWAKLTAVDVKGDTFDGQTDPFTIGELAMITLVGKTPAPPAEKPPLSEKLTVAPAPAPTKGRAAGDAELIKQILKVIAQPATQPAPALEQAEKEKLLERNLASGKDFFNNHKFAEAAAYFKIALYLAPQNKEAALYLAQAQEILQRKMAEKRQFYFWLAAMLLLVILAAAGVLWYVWYGMADRIPGALKETIPKGAPRGKISEGITERVKLALWYSRVGWTKNPFESDIVHKLFTDNNVLGSEGLNNFINSRIKDSGGKDNPFTTSAMDKVFELSKGKITLAFKICNWAVEQAIAKEIDQITAELIKGYERIGLKSILIADDDEMVRTTLNTILRKAGGYETDMAADGEETLKKIKENLYGMVLLDVEMPKINGYEILKQARAIYPDLPIIFVTGKGTPQESFESISKYNLTGYIEKPFTPEKILDMVARTLRV